MIGIVLVNWNGWKDTISCISSLMAMRLPDEGVYVCIVDNCSADKSIQHIAMYLEKQGYRENSQSLPHTTKIDERVSNVIHFSKGDYREQVGINGFYIVGNSDNYGFAAANNIGVKALNCIVEQRCDYYWLLNNDTEVDKDCLIILCEKMKSDARIGVCGTTLIYYGSDNIVQAYGGVNYSLLTGRGVTLGNGSVLNLDEINEAEIEKKLTYISGASMFVRREVFDKVGLLSEDYFLYYEEIDFSCRIKGLYLQGYAADSIVYHKEGASIGTGSIIRAPSLLSDYLQTKNKILFFRKFKKSSLLIVWLMGLMKVGKRIREGYYANARVILLALFGVFIPREKLVKR